MGKEPTWETGLRYYPGLDSQVNLYIVVDSNRQYRIAAFNQEGMNIGSMDIENNNSEYKYFDILGMDNQDNLYLACLYEVSDYANGGGYYDLFKYDRKGQLVAHGRLFQQYNNDYCVYKQYSMYPYPFFLSPDGSIYAYGYLSGEVIVYKIKL